MGRFRQALVAIATAALLAGGLVGVVSAPAGALTVINVTTSADSGAGSLRQAFIDASSGGVDQAADVEIDIPASVGTITLTGGQLVYDGGSGGAHTLTLRGSGNTVHQATASNRVIADTSSGLLTVSGLALTGGDDHGGAIFAAGSATVTDSTLSGNTGPGGGGAIFANGSVTVINSTISGNTVPAGSGRGGAIEEGGTITLVYATIADNTANPSANLDASGTGALVSFGSVVALPQSGGTNCNNLTGTTSHGFNLEDDAGASCGFSTGTGDLAPGTAPNLGALTNNGGPTQTMLPQPGSALIDAIPDPSCQADGATGITTDQRGFSRPSPPAGACDVGAVEVQVPVPPPPSAVVVTPLFTG